MSQGTSAKSGGAPSPEKFATETPVPAPTPAPVPTPASAAPKLRSCVVCRSRKVRCDKLSPCTNCRRANIQCVVPSNDRPPRWARRLERITNNAASVATPSQAADPGAEQVMDRLRNLESLVKELSAQLEQANAAAQASSKPGSSGTTSSGMSPEEQGANHQTNSSSSNSTVNIQKHFGRLVLQDESGSRYVSSGFWSRVSDELDGLKMDTRGLTNNDSDTSDDEGSPGRSPSTQELDRPTSERNSFFFRHNLDASASEIHKYRPLPSQIPFLVNTFEENVNFFYRIVHIPTITKLIREKRGIDTTPSNEALLFSIYYAAITSMEEDDVAANFGSTKADLNLKYRIGFEYAMARADFLNTPDFVLVQAFTVFLFLARRHDSPRFVWMMTGLVIRMAHAIGLQRDGSNFKHLSPYEVEMRRRVWKALCTLDIRSSEDQGSDLLITSSNSDTRLPLNINDADIEINTKETPLEREGLTDMSIALVSFEICEVVKQLMSGGLTLEKQSQLLGTVYDGLERRYLQYSTESGNIAYWVGVIATRLVISKMTLLIYLPVLFANPDEHFSEEIRNKLLVAAIEVAEYNHALNAEEACRQWRWIYQTYTHWHAVVYLLIETSRRLWSPTVERAWIALHSRWLIPFQSKINKNLRVWIPLKKLMAKARQHRQVELERIRGDPVAIAQLEVEDRKIPVPASAGPFPGGKSEDLLVKHWRSLVNDSAKADNRDMLASRGALSQELISGTLQHGLTGGSGFGQQNVWPNASFEPAGDLGSTNTAPSADLRMQPFMGLSPEQIEDSSGSPFTVPADWSGGQPIGAGFAPWLWADTDPKSVIFAEVDMNMDVDPDMNWGNWLQSAAGMDLNFGQRGTEGGDNWPAI